MAKVKLEGIIKQFSETVIAVNNFNAIVEDGTFVSFLGPSGCGKTTCLRMIAGFDQATKGCIYIGDKLVSNPDKNIFIPPEKRNIGMVFQNYAVWPHMNIFDNVAYPLRIKKIDKKTIKEKVKQALAIMQMEGMEKRYPHQLSGGQQQRVALARSLVMEPQVLLLDEPLSNLDAKLREDMRFEIKDLQRRLDITIVYVTHDQAEAMAMSDKIIVMNKGIIQQVGKPREIYQKPANRFVADFIGLTNFLEAKMLEKDGGFVLLDDASDILIHYEPKIPVPDRFIISIRPEKIKLKKENGEAMIQAKITRRTYLGDRLDYMLIIGSKQIRVQTNTDNEFRVGEMVFMELGEFTTFKWERK